MFVALSNLENTMKFKHMAAGLALGLSMFCTSTHADTKVAAVGVHLVSAHAQGQWNDQNYGMYVRWTSGQVLGTYRNSEYRQSVYAGQVFTVVDGPVITADVMVGVVSGYASGAIPAVIPTVGVRVADRTVLRTTFVPRVTRYGSAAVHLSVEFELN
jgi:hypothetical protein